MAPTFGASVICPPGLRDGVLEQFEEGLTRFAQPQIQKTTVKRNEVWNRNSSDDSLWHHYRVAHRFQR